MLTASPGLYPQEPSGLKAKGPSDMCGVQGQGERVAPNQRGVPHVMSMKMPSAYLLRSSGPVTLGGWKRGGQSTLALVDKLEPSHWMFPGSHIDCAAFPPTPHPWTVASQASLSMGFPRQVYWSGLPFPSPGDLPNPGMEPTSLMSPALAGRFFSVLFYH